MARTSLHSDEHRDELFTQDQGVPNFKKELFNDLDRAAEFDQSTMFKKFTRKNSARSEAIPIRSSSVITSLAGIRRTLHFWKRLPASLLQPMHPSSPHLPLNYSTWTRGNN